MSFNISESIIECPPLPPHTKKAKFSLQKVEALKIECAKYVFGRVQKEKRIGTYVQYMYIGTYKYIGIHNIHIGRYLYIYTYIYVGFSAYFFCFSTNNPVGFYFPSALLDVDLCTLPDESVVDNTGVGRPFLNRALFPLYAASNSFFGKVRGNLIRKFIRWRIIFQFSSQYEAAQKFAVGRGESLISLILPLSRL